MATMNEKAELTVKIDFGVAGSDSRLEVLNALAKLYEQPGTKLALTFAYGDVSDLLDAQADISHGLRYRNPDIKVTYATSLKDVDVIDVPAITPIERAIERAPVTVTLRREA